MTWATFFLFLISGYVAGKLFVLTNSRGRLKFLGLTIAAGILAIMQIGIFIDMMADNANLSAAVEFINEWGHITSLAFVLSSLAIFIRESKPVFAQFPFFYTALPLLILISYFFVQDTYALKNWLTAIYQGGAIIVSILMYSVYTYRKIEYGLILTGIGVFFLTFLLFWFIPAMQNSYAWIWKLMVGIAMVVTVVGYEKTEKQVMAKSI